MTSSLRNRAAIAGIGQTEFSKNSGRSELQLACEAVKAALDDAGLTPADVDGLVTFTMDSSEEMEVARNLGIQALSTFSRVPYGGGAAAGTVLQAAMAVATDVAQVVVVYRAFNERSGLRFGNFGGSMTGAVASLALLVRPVRPTDARSLGGYARPSIHARVRSDQPGLWAHRCGRPEARRDEP